MAGKKFISIGGLMHAFLSESDTTLIDDISNANPVVLAMTFEYVSSDREKIAGMVARFLDLANFFLGASSASVFTERDFSQVIYRAGSCMAKAYKILQQTNPPIANQICSQLKEACKRELNETPAGRKREFYLALDFTLKNMSASRVSADVFEATRSPDNNVRLYAIKVASTIGSTPKLDKAVLDGLIKRLCSIARGERYGLFLLKRPSVEEQVAAIKALNETGDPRAVVCIIELRMRAPILKEKAVSEREKTRWATILEMLTTLAVDSGRPQNGMRVISAHSSAVIITTPNAKRVQPTNGAR